MGVRPCLMFRCGDTQKYLNRFSGFPHLMSIIANNRLILISLFIAVGSSNPVAVEYAINDGRPPHRRKE